ncbi:MULTISPECIES: hypothetical protein [Rhizobium]|uniref:Uncharacterized protein n=1 Tax=Rhizobium paranaense TaxID=1650438 RepID=A0A7W8XYI3_9HYPH|nr:hypothetical protein [Rhizobium paranaense]MBB5577704.1 hypothetical protein [Rhizobium paranaense]
MSDAKIGEPSPVCGVLGKTVQVALEGISRGHSRVPDRVHWSALGSGSAQPWPNALE